MTTFPESALPFLMGKIQPRACWRSDLSKFRGLSDRQRSGFLLVLELFENFRLRCDLEAGRSAARIFWKSEVKHPNHKRGPWQLEQWESAMCWYLNWLSACEEANTDHRSLPERIRAAMNSAGSRQGLAKRTKYCYGALPTIQREGFSTTFLVQSGLATLGVTEVLLNDFGEREQRNPGKNPFPKCTNPLLVRISLDPICENLWPSAVCSTQSRASERLIESAALHGP